MSSSPFEDAASQLSNDDEIPRGRLRHRDTSGLKVHPLSPGRQQDSFDSYPFLNVGSRLDRDLSIPGLATNTKILISYVLGMSQRNSRGIVDSIQAKASEVGKEDFDKAKTLVNDAARSGSYTYPIKGIVYFVSHRALWKPFLSKLGPTLTLSAGVLAGMFAFTYLPQLAVLVFVEGPLAVFSTVLLVLNESSTLVSTISKTWVLQDALLDTFDGTLVARKSTDLVKGGREIKSGSDPIAKLGKIIKSPFERFTPSALIRYVMYLPLNFIPVVGTIIFITLQGRTRGKSVHDRYFQLKGWNSRQKSDWLQEHVGPYTAFGTVATLLEMIPFAGIFFSFTNAVGAALWAADIESKSTSMTRTTAPGLREAAREAE